MMKLSEQITALLKMLAMTHKAVEKGKVRPARQAFARVCARVKK